ncbi:enoyl-CoA hydratase [Kordiimonas laminariae]|uniref:enoyl-CoA hydratase n=1 Tax=Kordiimonas laminariae TaxID=2917717 RepID=UPI001FF58252|nr:enoyl-CoA hydratase [Kordiimonas laminariae]MCK0068705.1 enoyl-CoA hydratase [Kordiimonas laminariae]
MTDHVLTEIKDRILTITFNRPDKKNALTHAMYAKIADALEDAETNDDVRAVLFKSSAEAFTAGNDLVDFQQAGSHDGSEVSELPVARVLRAFVNAEKPYVAAVNGVAVGIGLTMLLHCDIVYVADEATIQAPFVDLALVPEAASSMLLPRLAGHVKAAEIFMLGKKVGADEAVSIGLANGKCSQEDLLPTAEKAAAALASKAPQAIRMTKRLMRGDKEVLGAKMQEENIYFGQQLKSPEVMEAIMAFMQKRAPNFG